MILFKEDVLDIYEVCLSPPGMNFSVDLFIHLVIVYQW